MPETIIYISYYTKSTPYQAVMKKYLLPSLKKFNLSYDIEAVPDLGNWSRNTSFKAKYVLQMLLKHKKTVIFIDADATIEKYPSLFAKIPLEYDIAVHYQDFYLQWRGQKNKGKFDLLTGTIMFRYNERVLNLVREWVERTKNSMEWEQKILEKLIEQNKDIEVFKLPVIYCTVINHKEEIPSYIKKEDVVIKHWQASRKYKSRNRWNKSD